MLNLSEILLTKYVKKILMGDLLILISKDEIQITETLILELFETKYTFLWFLKNNNISNMNDNL